MLKNNINGAVHTRNKGYNIVYDNINNITMMMAEGVETRVGS